MKNLKIILGIILIVGILGLVLLFYAIWAGQPIPTRVHPTKTSTLSQAEAIAATRAYEDAVIAELRQQAAMAPTQTFEALVAANLKIANASDTQAAIHTAQSLMETQVQEAVKASQTAQVMPLQPIPTSTPFQPVLTVIATPTPNIGATATQRVQTAEAEAQAQAEALAQSAANAQQQVAARASNFLAGIANQSPILTDNFDTDALGWTPQETSLYKVALTGGVLQIIVNQEITWDYKNLLPFSWMCDLCGPYQDYAYQIDLRTPQGVEGVLAGMIFGAPENLAVNPNAPYYTYYAHSSGAFYLRRISRLNDIFLGLWDRRSDLISPDGNFHTLQVIALGQYVTLAIDGVIITEAQLLDQPTDGYIGIVVSTAGGTPIEFDNLRVYQVP